MRLRCVEPRGDPADGVSGIQVYRTQIPVHLMLSHPQLFPDPYEFVSLLIEAICDISKQIIACLHILQFASINIYSFVMLTGY